MRLFILKFLLSYVQRHPELIEKVAALVLEHIQKQTAAAMPSAPSAK